MGNQSSTSEKSEETEKQVTKTPMRKGVLGSLIEKAEDGNIMACYDAGFMLVQGIECEKNVAEGLKWMRTGRKLEEQSENMKWKLSKSISKRFGPQTMDFSGLFLLMNLSSN